MMISRLIKSCYLICKWCSVSALLIVIIINCANLISRWFFLTSFDWILEASLILFVYSVMLIVPVLYHDRAFIRMHLVEEVLGHHGSRYINLIADLVVLAFVAYLFYKSLSLSLGQFHILSRGLGIPRFYVTIPLAIGAAFSLPIGVDTFFKHLAELKRTGKRA
jgi:TRAP-type C4-dicarboxylate transport system permease small subunit